jgi:hypothetical protein
MKEYCTEQSVTKIENTIARLQNIKKELHLEETETIEDAMIGLLREVAGAIVEMRELRKWIEWRSSLADNSSLS